MSAFELRPIPEHAGYFAGSDGFIYSTKRSPFPRRLAVGTDRDGYPNVQVADERKPGRSLVCAVHRLVARAFLPPRPSARHEVRHLDGVRTNSRPDNLAWGTQKDNANDRERHGRTVRGERSKSARLSASDVATIRDLLAVGITLKSIAQQFGVCIATIGHIKRGRNWRAA